MINANSQVSETAACVVQSARHIFTHCRAQKLNDYQQLQRLTDSTVELNVLFYLPSGGGWGEGYTGGLVVFPLSKMKKNIW